MRSLFKILCLDILRIVFITLAVIYFLAALFIYFEQFQAWTPDFLGWLKKILLTIDIFGSVISNKSLATVLNYFTAGLVFLLLNFFVEGIELRFYAKKN